MIEWPIGRIEPETFTLWDEMAGGGKLQEWIRRDLAENDALQEFCDVDHALSEDAGPAPLAMKPPKFRIAGKTTNYRKAHKQKEMPTILQSRVEELQQMIADRDSMRDKIQKTRIALDKLRVSNARTQRANIEGRQFLEKLRSEAENKKLEHLRQLEEVQLAEKKTKIENQRSRQAQGEITQKRNAAKEELDRATESVATLQQSLGDLRSKRGIEKKQLEGRLRKLRKENTELKLTVQEIEKRMAELGWSDG
jgi:chromosome segregation ATPase